ncbi:MAG: signal peptidase I [Oscillospiraceae bacterium]|nr:signal peptidase I [Oscillospiraceae bacterium]
MENTDKVKQEISQNDELYSSDGQILTSGNIDNKAAVNQRKGGWFIRDVFDWGETVVSALIIIVVVFTFIMRVTSVDGGSMMPTLQNKDQILVTNFFYTPKHNDIVVIYAPNLYNDEKAEKGLESPYGKDIIKRVIGVAGDTVRIETHADGDGMVYLNGEPITDLDKLFEETHYINSPTYVNGNQPLEITVPDGYVFVLGDNRGNSVDSRYIDMTTRQGAVGLVDINHIAGKAFFRVAGDKEVWGSFWNAFGRVI